MKNLHLPFAAVLLFACGGSTPATQTPSTTAAGGGESKKHPEKDKNPVCYEIHEQCEPFEGKGGAAQACHDMTYGATEDACTAKKTECMTACKK